jgi:hypothetical protein
MYSYQFKQYFQLLYYDTKIESLLFGTRCMFCFVISCLFYLVFFCNMGMKRNFFHFRSVLHEYVDEKSELLFMTGYCWLRTNTTWSLTKLVASFFNSTLFQQVCTLFKPNNSIDIAVSTHTFVQRCFRSSLVQPGLTIIRLCPQKDVTMFNVSMTSIHKWNCFGAINQ